MHDPLRVRRREGFGDLPRQLDRLHEGGAAAARQEVGKGSPLDELHHDVLAVAVRSGVEDADDRGLVQSRCRLCLPPEPGHEPGVARELGEQDLDRDRSVEHLVEASVDLGHTAGADPRFDPVALAQHGIAHDRSFTP